MRTDRRGWIIFAPQPAGALPATALARSCSVARQRPTLTGVKCRVHTQQRSNGRLVLMMEDNHAKRRKQTLENR